MISVSPRRFLTQPRGAWASAPGRWSSSPSAACRGSRERLDAVSPLPPPSPRPPGDGGGPGRSGQGAPGLNGRAKGIAEAKAEGRSPPPLGGPLVESSGSDSCQTFVVHSGVNWSDGVGSGHDIELWLSQACLKIKGFHSQWISSN